MHLLEPHFRAIVNVLVDAVLSWLSCGNSSPLSRSRRHIRCGTRRQGAKTRSLVALRTATDIERIVSRKSPPPVVTSEAVVTGRCAVFENRNSRHLASKGCPRGNRMTFVAAHALTGGVVTMSENGPEIILRLLRSAVRRQRMANGARADLALRRMTGVACRVRIDARLDRLPWARRRMAGRATLSGPAFSAIVGRMVKLHIEPLDKLCRKGFHRRLIRTKTRMADRAHRPVIVRRLIGYELIEVTANARIVTGVFQSFGFPISTVT